MMIGTSPGVCPTDTEVQALALAVQDLHAGYGAMPVLQGLHLSVAHGRINGILGHNGMGKSTLMKCLMGLQPTTAGHMVFNGRDLTRVPAHERAGAGIGYVPQGRGLIAALSTEDNLRLAWFKRSGRSEAEAIEAAMQRFPRLKKLLPRPGGSLSGGEQQLVALARSLMGDPWLLLLDEPTEGIQPSIIEEMADTLVALQREQGMTVLVVEQNMDFLLSCSERILVLEKGRFVADLDAAQLQDSAAVAELMGLGAGRLTSVNPAACSVR